MKYGYSATTNSFYDLERKDVFISFGTWPEDVIEVGDDVSGHFMSNPQPGKRRVAGDDGLPSWADMPPSTPEELEADASAKKASLISYAAQAIAPLKDALDGGYIDDEDKPKLTAWQKYRYALTKVDTSNPAWPGMPE